MAECKRLRIEYDDNFTREYCIVNGKVGVRTLAAERDSCVEWSWLTSDLLSIHVERNTVVAQWLKRRMGWRNLLKACVGEELWNPPGDLERITLRQ